MSGHGKIRKVGSRLVLVGTVHVDPASAALVRETVLRLRPEVVALELDADRLNVLQNPMSSRPSFSAGPSFLVMALLERFAGQLTGSVPGLEMLEAVRTAQTVGARVELIDRPIGATIAGLKKLPLREKVRIGIDGLASLILLLLGGVDLSGLMEAVESQLDVFRSRYPSLSKLLLDDRETYMARSIKRILDQSQGKVIGVVGFGHLASLAKAVEGYREEPGYSTSLRWTVGSG